MSINLTVVIDNDEAIKKFRELQKAAKTTTSEIVTDSERMDMAIRKFGTALASLGLGFSLTEMARQVATVRGEFQQLEVAFGTMLGSKAEADALMQRTVDLAATTPFDLQGVANGTKQLLAFGSTSEEVTDEIKMLGDIAAGLSIPLGDLVYLYGTTRTQGRLFTMDLRQFMGRGIPLADELAKQFGVTKDKVSELVTEGKVGFNDMHKALVSMTSEGGKFYNLMEEQSKTITGQMSNLEDSIQQMFNEIGKQSEGAISKAIGGVSTLVENYEKVGRILLDIIAAYGSYKAALIVVNAASKARAIYLAAEATAARMSVLLNKQITAEYILQAKALKALNVGKYLTNPYVLAGAAVAGLTFGIYKLATAKSAEEKAQEQVNARMDEYKTKLDEEYQKASQAASTMKDANASAYDRVKAYKTLVAAYPELLAKYDEEKIKLMELADLNRELSQINEKRTMDQLVKDRESLKEQIDAIERRKKVGVDGQLTFANASDAGQYKTLNEELKKTNKKIEEQEELSKQAAFEALSASEKIEKYQSEITQLDAKIAEYTGKLNEAMRLGQNELAETYNNTIKAAEEQKATLQKNIDSLKNANKNESSGGGADDIKQIASERQKAQKEAYNAELELQKSYLTDKAMLLQREKDEEIKAIEERIQATTDAETKAYLEKMKNAKSALYDKEIEKAMNDDAPLLFSAMDSIFSKEQRESAFKLDISPSKILREQAEQDIPAIEALFGDMRNMTSDDLNAIADAAEAMLSTIDDPEVLATMRDKIDELRNKAIELENPLEKIKNGIKGLFSFKPNTEGWNTSFESLGEGLEEVLALTEELDDVLESLGAGEALDGAIDGMNAALDAMDAAKKGAAIGQAFGGIGAVAGAAVGAVGSLVKSISQIHDKNAEKRIERLQDQIEDLEYSYEQLGYVIDKAYSINASEFIEQQNALLEQQKALIEKQIAEEDDKKKTDNDRIKEWEKEIDGINRAIEENVARAQEAITGISFESFRDSFYSSLSDMSKSSEDFAKDFEQMLQKAIINALMAEKYDERIKGLYDNFSEAMEDGKMTDAEIERLRAEKDAIFKEMEADRKAMSDAYGWTNESGSDTSSSSSGGGFQTMSQETGSELNGRFTDIQGKITEMRSFVMEMMAQGRLQYAETVNIRDIMIQINGNVADISAYTKVLPEMRDSINAMNRKLDNL